MGMTYPSPWSPEPIKESVSIWSAARLRPGWFCWKQLFAGGPVVMGNGRHGESARDIAGPSNGLRW